MEPSEPAERITTGSGDDASGLSRVVVVVIVVVILSFFIGLAALAVALA